MANNPAGEPKTPVVAKKTNVKKAVRRPAANALAFPVKQGKKKPTNHDNEK